MAGSSGADCPANHSAERPTCGRTASPAQGNQVDENSQVTLYVSKGQNTVAVPNIVGMSSNDAQSKITSSGFTVGTVTQQSSDQYTAGVVISQSPASGTRTDRGTAINYVVSTGPAPTPSPTPSTTASPTISPSTTVNQ